MKDVFEGAMNAVFATRCKISLSFWEHRSIGDGPSSYPTLNVSVAIVRERGRPYSEFDRVTINPRSTARN